MRARAPRTRKRKSLPRKQSLKRNLLLLFVSLVSLAATGRLFYLATSHNLYQPLEWRINKIAAKTPEAKVPEKQESESPKVAAAGMDYLFWKILRDEQPVTNP